MRGHARSRPQPGAPPVGGYTLLELLLVVAVLGILATAVGISGRSTDPYAVDGAAAEVAAAFRFARDEALRTGMPHGVDVDPATLRLRLFRDTTGALPPAIVYDVVHPLTKSDYDVDLASLPGAHDIALGNSTTWMSGCANPGPVYFDATGRGRCTVSWPVQLDSSTIVLQAAGHRRSVIVDGETGRVALQ